jgi:hypothetical protein
VVNGWANPAVLDTYSRERRPSGIANALQSRHNASAVDDLYQTLGAAIAADSLEELPLEEVARLLNGQWDHLNSPALQFGYTYGAVDNAEAPTGRYTPSGGEATVPVTPGRAST